MDDRHDDREAQLEYSELQPKMHDEGSRRQKAAKIVAVVQSFLGRDDLTGLRVVDVGCSTGYIASELARAGGTVTGVDIDEPGLAAARERFGDEVELLLSDGETLPLPDASADVVVLNHIYEHVLDPEAVMAEIRRILAPDGVVYLGLGNRLGVVEPHYSLPFLSWLPKPLAHRYVRATGRAPEYFETFRTRAGLRRLCAGLTVWDYTWTVLAEPAAFAADDMVPRRLAAAPVALWRALGPVVPTYLWVGTPGDRRPATAGARVAPARVSTPAVA